MTVIEIAALTYLRCDIVRRADNFAQIGLVADVPRDAEVAQFDITVGIRRSC